jgi:hypothetical protein
MPQKLLHKFGVHALRKQECGASVPQVVEASLLWKFSPLQEPLEWPAIQRPLAHRSAGLVWEHEAIVVVEIARLLYLLQLALEVRP